MDLTEQKRQCIKSLPYYDKLTDTDKRIILDNSAVREYKKGDTIFNGGTRCLGHILILSGDVRSYILSEEGREVTLFRLHEGDTCVLSASCVIEQITFDSFLTADSDCRLFILSSAAFGKITDRNIYVRCFMYELLTERFSTVVWTLQQILFMGYDKRLAAFLISEFERTGNTEIHMTHEQIAANTGSAREVVARMLKRFVGEGYVESRRGCITLTDIEALKNL